MVKIITPEVAFWTKELTERGQQKTLWGGEGYISCKSRFPKWRDLHLHILLVTNDISVDKQMAESWGELTLKTVSIATRGRERCWYNLSSRYSFTDKAKEERTALAFQQHPHWFATAKPSFDYHTGCCRAKSTLLFNGGTICYRKEREYPKSH